VATSPITSPEWSIKAEGEIRSQDSQDALNVKGNRAWNGHGISIVLIDVQNSGNTFKAPK